MHLAKIELLLSFFLLICILVMYKSQHMAEYCFANQIYPCRCDIFSKQAKSHSAVVYQNNKVTLLLQQLFFVDKTCIKFIVCYFVYIICKKSSQGSTLPGWVIKHKKIIKIAKRDWKAFYSPWSLLIIKASFYYFAVFAGCQYTRTAQVELSSLFIKIWIC